MDHTMNVRYRLAGAIALTCALGALPSLALAQAPWADRLKGTLPVVPPVSEPATDEAAPSVPVGVEHETLAAGLKEALAIGSQRAVETASKTDGYLGNPAIRIPMPGLLGDASSMLRGIGLGRQVDAFEKSMNRAAEKAAPKAAGILVDAVREMTIDDARSILVGSPDGATRFLRRRAGDPIADEFRPIIAESMQEQGVTAAFTALSEQAKQRLPALETADALDLPDYVTRKSVDGLFVLLAEEEKKIRADPAARTTDLLREVFGGSD
ncbi:hypothetical protein TVNIR_1898 [Thioalkalivibrio nitratireducens DSM 14787]|uniref:DUF4197 domain-containing protein n=2 Tax=Thioalkalivibrio nitratireducens TaxID=186931 RepID=L0DVC8_THIND|nr:hypothetical protein TVNIR_1898 [Thioalkalivibrio nitratireducens DSM 14787]